MRCFPRLALIILITAAHGLDPSGRAPAQQAEVKSGGHAFSSDNPLSELRDKRRAYLVAGYTYEVDASSLGDARRYARAILAEVADQKAVLRRRHKRAYRTIADRLKKYGRRHKSLVLVERPEEADFYIVFYVTGKLNPVAVTPLYEHHGVLPLAPFPTGHLLVVRKGAGDDPEPKIVAHTERGGWAKDVIDRFIKELKAARGER